MKQREYTNKWKTYHKALHPVEAEKFKAEIERVLRCHQSAFYRYISDPERYLSIAEKWAIERIYKVEEGRIFPELHCL